jgi:PucR family transcriptional regulator, purine catabolism regulatory protein
MLADAIGAPVIAAEADEAPKRGDYFCVYPTLAELMVLAQFGDARLLTDPTTVAGRRVRFASVQEPPPEYVVRSDELVLTTGAPIGDDPEVLIRLIREVAAAHGAAVGIATGADVRSVAPPVVAEARRLGVPVFTFPTALRFGEVMEACLSLVVERQHTAIHYSDEMHRLFMRTALEGGGLQELCRIVEASFARPICIIDRSRKAWDGGPASLARQSAARWKATATRIPIEGEGRLLGTLLVGSSAGSLSHVEEAVASDMKMERESGELGDRSARSPLAAETAGATSLDVARGAAALGFESQRPYAVVRVTLSARDEATDVSAIARASVQRALDVRGIQAVQAWEGSSVTLLVPLAGAAVPPTISNLLSDITAMVRRQDQGIVVTSGVGRVIPGLSSVAAGVRDASTAGALGAIVKGPGSVTNYTDLGAYPALYQALFSDAGGAALAELEARYLGATIDYESRSGLPLTETLAVYFRNNGNVSATARDLGINRQSLLYRLERFHQISGVDLSSRVDRFALELAVECWRLRRAVETSPAGDSAAFAASSDPAGAAPPANDGRPLVRRVRSSLAQVAG